jgi:carboxylesterase
MVSSPIMRGAEPYFHRGNRIGCLCLHGFTASPHEVLWLAQHLAGQGCTVHAPRLAGHGTHPRDLVRTTWKDWLTSALDGYHLLRQQCDQVYVCGMSMGGLLALMIGAVENVDGLVVMASPLIQKYPLNPHYLRSMKYIRPYTDQSDRSSFADYICTEQARRGEPVLGRVRYSIWATAAVEQLALLIGVTARQLKQIQAPLLALYSRADVTVDLDSLELLKSRVHHIEAFTFKKSGHILTQDVECEAVFQKTASFIAHHAARRKSGEQITMK